MTASIVVPAYAKINLTLDVLAKRSDGYHDIRSVMQTIALHDTLEITHTPDRPGVRLTVAGEEGDGVPDDASNIVHRAAVRLQKTAVARGRYTGDRSGLRITLTKRIPSQAGLGGGSSDAAATLCAINTLFDLNLSHSRLTEIAVSLGADVPFFLTGGTALVEGLGERVTPLTSFDAEAEDLQIVIVKPPIGVSTAIAYATLDADITRVSRSVTEKWLAGDRLDFGNDFQDTVLTNYPQVRRAYEALGAGNGLPPLLCGSGAALFRAVPDRDVAQQLASRLQAGGFGKTWVTQIQGRNE